MKNVKSKRRLRSDSGMTLIELMVVTAIIGTLASMLAQQFSVYKIKAARAEAYSNINAFKALIVSYHAANETLPATAAAGPNPVQSSWYPVVSDNTSSADSCRSDNVFGFHLGDCSKARYSYWYISSSGPGEFAIGAWNNGRICPGQWIGEAMMYCPATGKIRQYKDAAKNSCADVWVTSPSGCQGRE